jgi:hypothetical protein
MMTEHLQNNTMPKPMESKVTAVEWLVNRWKKLQSKQEKMTWNQIIQITELAKELEKEQIIDIDYRLSVIEDYAKGEVGDEITNLRKYINETYGNQANSS